MRIRRVHSTIDKLPKDLQKSLEAMLIDNLWPDDYKGERVGKPRYVDLQQYCKQKGHKIASSTIGRFGKQMRVLAAMKQNNMITQAAMSEIDAECISQTQKAAAQIITAKINDLAIENDLTAKQLKEIAQAVRDCTNVSIKAENYKQEQLKSKAQKTADTTSKKLKNAGVDRKQVQEIIDDILGITK